MLNDSILTSLFSTEIWLQLSFFLCNLNASKPRYFSLLNFAAGSMEYLDKISIRLRYCLCNAELSAENLFVTQTIGSFYPTAYKIKLYLVVKQWL